MMGGIASQNENLAQLSKVTEEKPTTKRNLTRFGVYKTCFINFKILIVGTVNNNLAFRKKIVLIP